MKSSSLKKWGILKHLTDDELANIKYLHVYGVCGRSSDDGLSALYVTNDDEVFGTGLNSMVGLSSSSLTFDQNASQGKSVKLEALSGLGITKIVVGKLFGAALSKKGEVYIWGYVGDPVVEVRNEDIVMFESYVAGKSCKFCGSRYPYRQELVGSTSISKCTESCRRYPTYTTSSPLPSGTAVQRFFKFSESVLCPNCMGPTIPRTLNGDFHFCVKCNKMLEIPSYRTNNVLLTKSNVKLEAPFKLGVSELWKIRDIYCGSSFLVIETSSPRSLSFWGTIGVHKYQSLVQYPEILSYNSVSCGGSHLAVISSDGELYTCGSGDKGQLGYQKTFDMDYLTLRKVPLNGRVLKVCCGLSSTACLMSNGSVIGIDSKLIAEPSNILDSKRFTAITHSPLTNVFCAKTNDLIIYRWCNSRSAIPEIQFKASDLSEALADLPYAYMHGSREEETVEQLSLHSTSTCPDIGTFFGNKSFSDLTLKLADGEFPVHRLVLYSSSYFKKILSDSEFTSNIMDMSSYNPTAYKCLLKYFYRLPLDDLNCEDLFDLHSIACSYKEKELSDYTFNKLKTMINQDTVLKLHAKATSTNAEDILRDCELFLSSAEFKDDLISFVSQDMKNAIAILQVKNGK